MKPQRLAAWVVSLVTMGLVAASWVALYARLVDPDRLPGGYNSDSAIPVLMSNDDVFRIESLYYWGQDRFSGVPYLVASLVHRVTHFFWTPVALVIVQATWVLLAAVLMGVWSRRWLPAFLLASVLLVGRGAEMVFDISQPYGFQITWTLFASLVLARVVEGEWQGWVPAAGLALLTWMAHAANVMTGTWLLAVALLEIIVGAGERKRLARWVLAPVVAGIVIETAVRVAFHQHHASVHRNDVVTQTVLSLHRPMRFFVMMLANFAWWQLLGAAACVAIGVWWLRARTVPRWLLYPAIFTVLNMLTPPLVKHIQLNDVAERYFDIALIFAPFVLLGLFAWRLEGKWFAGAVVLPFIAMGPLFVREPEGEHVFATDLAVARQLAARAPNSVLSSGYWETFVLSSLVERPALTPVVRHGQMRRSDHFSAALTSGAEIWLGNRLSDGAEGGTPAIDFFDHVLIASELFVSQGDRVVIEGREFRRYQPASIDSKRRMSLCPETTIEVSGQTVIVSDVPVTFDVGRPEGAAWSFDQPGKARISRCITAWVFELTPSR